MEYKYPKPKRSSAKVGPSEAKFICENYGKIPTNILCRKIKLQDTTVYKILRLNKIKRNIFTNFWNRFTIEKEAKKYLSRLEFAKNRNGAVHAAKKLGIYDKVCKHMIASGNIHNKHLYIYKFIDNSVYIGTTYSIKKRHNDHMRGLLKNKTIKEFKYTKLMPVDKAIKLEEEFRQYYINLDIKVHNKVKCALPASFNSKYTKSECIKEALKYTLYKDFVKKSKSFYRKSRDSGWLDEVTFHLDKTGSTISRKVMNKETGQIFKSIADAARKYKTDSSSICAGIRKRHKTLGYTWEYV